MYDDLALCYTEVEPYKLHFSHYIKFYGTRLDDLHAIFSQKEIDVHDISTTDPMFLPYSLRASRDIARAIPKVTQFHPG
jgi:repressor of nif and glnA expression